MITQIEMSKTLKIEVRHLKMRLVIPIQNNQGRNYFSINNEKEKRVSTTFTVSQDVLSYSKSDMKQKKLKLFLLFDVLCYSCFYIDILVPFTL